MRHRGMASTSLRLATAFAFERLGLHRLELFHAVENVGSCRVATKIGFLLEGTARQSYRYGDGRFHDEHLHARLATDPVDDVGGGVGGVGGAGGG